jgi:hypothetical protein
MRTDEVKKYIENHQDLFWYTPQPKSEKVTDDLLVETILNYGTMDDVRELFRVMGMKNVAKIFYETTSLSERRKGNYFELVYNYFNLFFSRYAL